MCYDVPALIFRCCKLSGDSKIEAILTASLLLPPLHSASLTCLMRFLSDVAEASAENKMDSRYVFFRQIAMFSSEFNDFHKFFQELSNRLYAKFVSRHRRGNQHQKS